jgi:hypothetical protein
MLPANGQPVPAGWQSIVSSTWPQQTGHRYLHLIQAPTPQPSPWRDHVDMSGLAAANRLTAQLRAARFDQNVQAFFNHATALGMVIDQIVNGLPHNVRNASRVLQDHPGPTPLPPNVPAPRHPRLSPDERAFRRAQLQLALRSERTVALLQVRVAKALVDFKVATMPVRVSRMLLDSSVRPSRLGRIVFLDLHQETTLGVFLMLMTGGTPPGQPMVTAKGLARSFLTDVGIGPDDELEGLLIASISGTISDWLHYFVTLEGAEHLQTTRKQQIFTGALHRWLTSQDLVIQFDPEESGPIPVTHPEVVAFVPNPYLQLYAHGNGIRAVAVQPGTTILTVEMANAFKELTFGHADLAFQIKEPNGPLRPLPPRPPLPDPNASPTPGPMPGPQPSNPPGGPQASPSVPPELRCVQLPSGQWIHPELCEAK